MTTSNNQNRRVGHDVYKETGVDTGEADSGLERIVARVLDTWPKEGAGRILLDIGRFANVIDFGGIGLALCTDGVGSKSIIAEMMGKYDTIGIDCIAMNVNDLICVGAKPLSLVDYIAVEQVDAEILDSIAEGLCEGAKAADISISGGEIAQLRDVVRGFDLVGTAVGRVDLDKIIVGQDIAGGDVVIGVRSNGVHSNGLSLARRAFFELNRYNINHKFDELSCTLGEELLRPTHIYVREALEILEQVKSIKALINITSDGLLNLTRVPPDVGYVIDNLIEPHPVFSLIQQHANVDDAEMFQIFNMGIGFCVVVGSSDVERTLSILSNHGRDAQIIGHAVADPLRKVWIEERHLMGQGKLFWKEESLGERHVG